MRNPELREVRPLPQDHTDRRPQDGAAVQNWIHESLFVMEINIQVPEIRGQCGNCATVNTACLPAPPRSKHPGSGPAFPVSATRWQPLGAEASEKGLGWVSVSPARILGEKVLQRSRSLTWKPRGEHVLKANILSRGRLALSAASEARSHLEASAGPGSPGDSRKALPRGPQCVQGPAGSGRRVDLVRVPCVPHTW